MNFSACKNLVIKHTHNFFSAYYAGTLDIAKLFTLIELKPPSPRFGWEMLPRSRWTLQNLMFKGKVCSIWTFNFEYLFVDILLTSLASGADDQWPRTILSKQTTNVKFWKTEIKSSYATNFALKHQILKCWMWLRDKTTSKSRWWWLELDGRKKFCDI